MDHNMEAAQIKLDKTLHAELKLFCQTTGIGKSSFITMAIRGAMDRKKQLYRLIKA